MNELPSDLKSDLAAADPLERVLPAEVVFLTEAETAQSQVAASQPGAGVPGAGLPGPGFFESIAWMFGLYAVQIVVVILATGLLFASFMLRERFDPARFGPAELYHSLGSLYRKHQIEIFGIVQGATVVYGLLAIWFRIRPSGLRRLGWQFPWLGHWLLVILLMPPLCLLCSVLQNAMFEWVPSAETTMKEFMESLAQAPLGLLILVIGMGPALAEELVFRGLVGRGLVARWGLFRGMLITSALFGMMHLNPAQAIGVIPLGFAMHFVYFTTRSFWAPVTLHLFNNSLSVILLKYGAGRDVDTLFEQNSALPVPLLTFALAMVIAIGMLLWQTRVQYFLPNGSLWNPGYTSTEAPPPDVNAVGMRRSARMLFIAGSVLSALGFVAAVWQRGM